MKPRSNPRYKEIYEEVLKASGYSEEDLKGSSRKRSETDKRAAISCIMSDLKCNSKQIADMLNRKYAVVIKSYLPAREYVKDEIERIKNKLKSIEK